MLHYLASIFASIKIVAAICCLFLSAIISFIFCYFINDVKDIYDENETEYKSCVRNIAKLMLAILICVAIIVFLPSGETFLAMMQ